MKKILLSLLLATSLFAASCTPVRATEDTDFIVVEKTKDVSILLDKVTGVEYIYKEYNDLHNGPTFCICPRYNPDGTLFTANQEE